MLRYAVKRMLGALPTLFLIITIAFFMMRLAPGGPFDKERNLPAQVEANLNKAYHLDEPLPQQYLRYVGNILQGDFGPSFQYKDFSVTELIWGGFPVSLRLGGLAILFAFGIGVALGTVAALNQNSLTDYLVMGTAMTGITIPNFVMAPLLTLVFGLYLSWLPVGGWGGGGIAHSVLPIVALCLPQVAAIARLTRGSMIEVLRSNFMRTARAKGLPERVTILRHGLKAAMLPVVSYLGPAVASIITGSVIIEQIFGIPGIGRYFVQAALNRDYTLVMGVTIFYGVLIILFNLLVDLLYGLLDPKVRYD
ncbi:oligopeptide ABC transporter permease OppB [Rhodospirillaceae bacterium SYSU D60014]|uniref:oligopeptide ABC transporter permease OppB n=1 Tax=Virgifigura deserti TaxID=2268457 RepID=UPI000E6755A6